MLLADFSQTAVARKNINAGRSECGAARGVFSRRTAAVIARALPIGLPNTRPIAAPLISFPIAEENPDVRHGRGYRPGGFPGIQDSLRFSLRRSKGACFAGSLFRCRARNDGAPGSPMTERTSWLAGHLAKRKHAANNYDRPRVNAYLGGVCIDVLSARSRRSRISAWRVLCHVCVSPPSPAPPRKGAGSSSVFDAFTPAGWPCAGV
jgi:hypothetical protein